MSHRILISEDDEALTKVWSQLLTKHGYDVDVANDGDAALRKWEKNPYDIVLVDLITPRLLGIDLLKRIKAKQPWTQAIIISGQGKEQDKLDALNLHVFAYLEKPVKFDKLHQTILEALEQRDLTIRSLEQLVANSLDPNEDIIAVGSENYSAQRLFDEARMGTETGKAYLETLKEVWLRKRAKRSAVAPMQAGGIFK